MTHFTVWTPPYDGNKKDVICLDAEDKYKARTKAIQVFKNKFPRGWIRYKHAAHYVQLRVSKAECSHGKMNCTAHNQNCKACETDYFSDFI